MTEKSAQEKLAELDQRDSNTETVENIATTGHVASVGITVVSMVGATAKVGLAAAAAKTCAAGIAKAVAGFGGPLVAGMAGGMLGGWLGTKAGDWFMDTWGKDHAVSGPTDIPACVGHHIVHNNSFLGAIGGLIWRTYCRDCGWCTGRCDGRGCAGGTRCHCCCRSRRAGGGICRRCRDGHWFPLGL